MQTVPVLYDQNERLRIIYFGHEPISSDAHWGRGRRSGHILHYVLTGEGVFNGHPVRAGQGFYIAPEQLHEYHASTHHPWTYFFVILSGSDAGAVCRRYLAPDANGVFHYDFQPDLLRLMDDILRHPHLTDASSLAYFFTLLSLHEKNAPLQGNRHVTEALKYIEGSVHRPVTVREVADHLHLSDRYLYNLFIRHLQRSPRQVITDAKMHRARALLESTDSSITEIAASLGFDDVLAFSRFFRKNQGLSPTAYRCR